MLVKGDPDWDHQWGRVLFQEQYSLGHLDTRPGQEWLVAGTAAEEKYTVAFQTLALTWEIVVAEQGRGWSAEEVELKLLGVEHLDNMPELDQEVGQKLQWVGPQDMADTEQQDKQHFLVDILHRQWVVDEQGKYFEFQGRVGEVPEELMVGACPYMAELLLLQWQWELLDKVLVHQSLLKL